MALVATAQDPEKKAPEMTDGEKTIFDILQETEEIELDELKEKSGLSNKKWDKGMKGLNKLGIAKVQVDGDQKTVMLL